MFSITILARGFWGCRKYVAVGTIHPLWCSWPYITEGLPQAIMCLYFKVLKNDVGFPQMIRHWIFLMWFCFSNSRFSAKVWYFIEYLWLDWSFYSVENNCSWLLLPCVWVEILWIICSRNMLNDQHTHTNTHKYTHHKAKRHFSFE